MQEVVKMVSIPVIREKAYHDNTIGNKCSHEWDLNPYHNYISSCDIKKCIHCGVRKTIFIPSYKIVWPAEGYPYIEFRWREGVTKRYKLEPIINKLEQLGILQEIKP